MKIRALAQTRTLAIVAASLLALSACKEDKKADAAAVPAAGALVTQDQKVSYILGMQVGGQFKANNMPIDQDSFIEGIKTAKEGSEPKLTKEQIQETMMAFQNDMQKKHEEQEKAQKAEMDAKAAQNKIDGEKYLAANKAKPGVITTASGLQYEVLVEGKGPKPKETDTVTVHYRGTLVDGTEFDSSYKRNEPATFALNAVIPGWIEALQLMPEGSKWKIVLPSDLGYGPGGTGGPIGPNATLIFEVELLKASVAPETAPAQEPAKAEAAKPAAKK
ncbi:MAG TPA: FKBP-type peptidyl-prolyl cis-trans isomerase [Pseudomonadales bacterium]|nr:FKBP-type peptidyl-prolyl cis-trans isomerase [Pseudomonadales bacterium]